MQVSVLSFYMDSGTNRWSGPTASSFSHSAFSLALDSSFVEIIPSIIIGLYVKKKRVYRISVVVAYACNSTVWRLREEKWMVENLGPVWGTW